MTEEFMYFLWIHSLYQKQPILSTSGETIEIVYQGIRNNDAGPDFLDAKIRIGNQLWVGAVEMHLQSSDWNKHSHNSDKIYDSVVLHVVMNYDCDIFNTKGSKISTLILQFDSVYLERYKKIITTQGPIPCSSFLNEVKTITFKNWFNRLIVNRLERKIDEVLFTLSKSDNSFENTFYKYLAKNMGFKVNSLPFQMLAESLPYKAIAKQKDSLLQIEALLFGQAGFLQNTDDSQEYVSLLKREYVFLSQKYNLKPIDVHLWKFMRMRPQNFPTIRIAQFANILFKNINLFSQILENFEFKSIVNLFKVDVSEYWQNHYNFTNTSKKVSKKLSEVTINNIVVNSVSTVSFAYAYHNNDNKLKEKILDLLEQIKPEKNNIVDKWQQQGVYFQNALQTQASIELFNEYCQKNRCLDCAIGGTIISFPKYYD